MPDALPANNDLVITPAEYRTWKERRAAAETAARAAGVEAAWVSAFAANKRAGMLPPDAAEAALRQVAPGWILKQQQGKHEGKERTLQQTERQENADIWRLLLVSLGAP